MTRLESTGRVGLVTLAGAAALTVARLRRRSLEGARRPRQLQARDTGRRDAVSRHPWPHLRPRRPSLRRQRGRSDHLSRRPRVGSDRDRGGAARRLRRRHGVRSGRTPLLDAALRPPGGGGRSRWRHHPGAGEGPHRHQLDRVQAGWSPVRDRGVRRRRALRDRPQGREGAAPDPEGPRRLERLRLRP